MVKGKGFLLEVGILGWGGPVKTDEVSNLEEGTPREQVGMGPRTAGHSVSVGFTPSTRALYNVLRLTHPREWGTAPPTPAESPGTGPAFPWGSESMPGGPRADQSPSTGGGHRSAGKDIRTEPEETEVVTGTGRPEDCAERKGQREKDPQPRSPWSGQEDSRSSLPPPAGRRGTQQDAREPLPGRPP